MLALNHHGTRFFYYLKGCSMLRNTLNTIRYLAMVPMLLAFATTASAVTMEEMEARIAEAEQLRAVEFSPSHYAQAKESLAKAKQLMMSGDNDSARRELDSSADHISLAVQTVQTLSNRYSGLVESRDRMQMTDPVYLRDDLVERAEKDFSRVVEAVEDGNLDKADAQGKLALDTLRAAQVVASREQYSRPIAKGVAAARKVDARKRAPNALNEALEAQKKVEDLIKDDPDAQVKMYAASKQGEYKAERAMKISALGAEIDKNPAAIETFVDSEEARLNLIGKRLGVDLSQAKDAEEQALLLQQAIAEMEQGYKQQLQDADKQIEEMNAKLGTYEGDLASMAEMRRKLQLTRDAEAKIKRLTKLFDANDVEILLTPDADVILRMKSLNFRSGSAVIPPEKYAMLDSAGQAILMFADRAVRVEGHTDSAGANAYNQTLSERRAQAVKMYMSEKLDGPHAIEGVGFGEEKPIANNETAKGREKNRRIDIVLIAPRT
jgi:outer membrane protein OmpA-like peptidoglycan-associated protein